MMPDPTRLRPSRRPTIGRFLVHVACAILAATSAASAEEPAAMLLTETDVIHRAVERAPLGDAMAGAVDVQRGVALAVSAYPNPIAAYWREQTFGPLGTKEDYASLTQFIDLGNRRGLRGEAGEARARAAALEGKALRLSVAAEARLRFGDAIHRERRSAALRLWIERIDGALAVVAKRTARGDAAIYDRRRLHREQIVATARLESEEAARERALLRLRAIIGARAPVTIAPSGTFLPDADPPAIASLRARAERRPDFLALDAYRNAAELERRAASRWWIPDLRLEGGFKGVDLGAQGRSDGFLAGAALVLPIWDRSAGFRIAAQGEARAASGRRGLALMELDGELAGSYAEAVRLRRAAIRFRGEATAASSDLVRIANAGYAGGEMSVIELLDAYRGAADDELTALDMELAARRARIELDRLSGTEGP